MTFRKFQIFLVAISLAGMAVVVVLYSIATNDPKPPSWSPVPTPNASWPSYLQSPVPTGEPVRYDTCVQVHAAGLSAIRKGDPGWADHLDRDGDGVACER